MAHEWAHIVQFSKGHRNAGKSVELHADFLAGWFLAARVWRGNFLRTSSDRKPVIASSFTGTTTSIVPDHHGTGVERASAIQSGFELAAKVNNVDAAYRARSL